MPGLVYPEARSPVPLALSNLVPPSLHFATSAEIDERRAAAALVLPRGGLGTDAGGFARITQSAFDGQPRAPRRGKCAPLVTGPESLAGEGKVAWSPRIHAARARSVRVCSPLPGRRVSARALLGTAPR